LQQIGKVAWSVRLYGAEIRERVTYDDPETKAVGRFKTHHSHW
jgi:hypothetical protein